MSLSATPSRNRPAIEEGIPPELLKERIRFSRFHQNAYPHEQGLQRSVTMQAASVDKIDILPSHANEVAMAARRSKNASMAAYADDAYKGQTQDATEGLRQARNWKNKAKSAAARAAEESATAMGTMCRAPIPQSRFETGWEVFEDAWAGLRHGIVYVRDIAKKKEADAEKAERQKAAQKKQYAAKISDAALEKGLQPQAHQPAVIKAPSEPQTAKDLNPAETTAPTAKVANGVLGPVAVPNTAAALGMDTTTKPGITEGIKQVVSEASNAPKTVADNAADGAKSIAKDAGKGLKDVATEAKQGAQATIGARSLYTPGQTIGPKAPASSLSPTKISIPPAKTPPQLTVTPREDVKSAKSAAQSAQDAASATRQPILTGKNRQMSPEFDKARALALAARSKSPNTAANDVGGRSLERMQVVGKMPQKPMAKSTYALNTAKAMPALGITPINIAMRLAMKKSGRDR